MRASPGCLDACFIVRWMVDEQAGPRADGLLKGWRRQGRRLVSPFLMPYEVTNALYRYMKAGELTRKEVVVLLDLFSPLEVVFHCPEDLYRRAIRLSERFSLPAAYDAYYLALAERLGAELWTADRRLANLVGSLDWVNLL